LRARARDGLRLSGEYPVFSCIRNDHETTDIMHEAFADRICSGMHRAVRQQPFGPGMVVWTIDGRMFAAYTEAGHGLSLRVPEMEADEMAANGDAQSHTPLSEVGWVLIPWQTQPEDLRRRIALSYEMVLADGNATDDRD
jgi:hypothetical protein